MKHTKTHLQLAMKRLNPRRRLKRMGKIQPPLSIERDYLRFLVQYLDDMYEILNDRLIKNLHRFAGQLDLNRPDGTRQDSSITEQLLALMDETRLQFAQEYSDEEIRRIARSKGVQVSTYNEKVFKQGIKRIAGVDVFFSQPYLADQLALFTIQNTNLIKSLRDDTLNKVQTTVFEGMKSGLRVEELAKDIRGQIDPWVGNVRARAELIARDQIGKLNGQLNFLRQSELGIRRYRWRTVGDERVRDSHDAKNGQIFSWDDAPADTGHPGEDFQCRCQAEPVFEDLVPGMSVEE